MSINPEVAISPEFLTSVLSLPKTQQDKVVRFMEHFKEDPQSPALNYETIRGAKDKHFHSVRIDQFYRAIVLAPEKGNVYIFLRADKHDNAYAWAQKKVLKANPKNDALPFLKVDYSDKTQQLKGKSEGNIQDLLSTVRDRHLIRLGVPEDLIPLIRKVEISYDLEELKKKLPDETYEALSMLAYGDDIDQVLSVYGVNLLEEEAIDNKLSKETKIRNQNGQVQMNIDSLLPYYSSMKSMLESALSTDSVNSIKGDITNVFGKLLVFYEQTAMRYFDNKSQHCKGA